MPMIRPQCPVWGCGLWSLLESLFQLLYEACYSDVLISSLSLYKIVIITEYDDVGSSYINELSSSLFIRGGDIIRGATAA